MILLFSGLDQSSGAGLSIDLKTSSKLGIYSGSLYTSITVQNNERFLYFQEAETKILEDQIDLILQDIQPKFIKIGLLPSKNLMQDIDDLLNSKLKNIPKIIDPVISSTTGKKILSDETINYFKNNFLKNSYLLTPNINEAQILSDIKISNIEDVKNSAKKIQNLGAKNVIIKGAHLNEDKEKITHLLLDEEGKETIFYSDRIKLDGDVRGTGCMFATAISCFLIKGFDLEQAIKKANKFVSESIKNSVKIGSKYVML